MTELIAGTLWVAVHALGVVPMIFAYFWGKRTGRRETLDELRREIDARGLERP